MQSLEDSAAFRHRVEVFVKEARTHGWVMGESGAAKLLAGRVDEVASLAGMRPASVLDRYLDEEEVRTMVRALLPTAAAVGATGRDDERPLPIEREAIGHLIAMLGQAGRFSTTHGGNLPDAGLHNLVADALVIIGGALAATGTDPAFVPAYGLRLARRAFELVASGIRSGWVLALDEPVGGTTVAALTEVVGNFMEELAADLDKLLPELPPPMAVC